LAATFLLLFLFPLNHLTAIVASAITAIAATASVYICSRFALSGPLKAKRYFARYSSKLG